MVFTFGSNIKRTAPIKSSLCTFLLLTTMRCPFIDRKKDCHPAAFGNHTTICKVVINTKIKSRQSIFILDILMNVYPFDLSVFYGI